MTSLSVSTIIPTYNRAHLIDRAVSSVIAASSPQDEILVIDDGSTDNTSEVLSKYGESIRYIRTSNAGAGAARNRGVREATGDLVAFLDSDDEWLPHKLSLQRRFMEARPDVLFAFTDFIATDKMGNQHHNYLKNWHKDPRPWSEILGPAEPLSAIADFSPECADIVYNVGNLYLAELSANYVSVQTLIVRRAEAGDALTFAEDIPLYEDWHCAGLLARKGVAAFVDCETCFQHCDATERLTDARSLLQAESRISVIERVWGQNMNFLAGHGDIYSDVLDEQRLTRAKDLVLLGRNREAREELGRMKSAPRMLRLLTSFPDWAVKKILAMKSGSANEGEKV